MNYEVEKKPKGRSNAVAVYRWIKERMKIEANFQGFGRRYEPEELGNLLMKEEGK